MNDQTIVDLAAYLFFQDADVRDAFIEHAKGVTEDQLIGIMKVLAKKFIVGANLAALSLISNHLFGGDVNDEDLFEFYKTYEAMYVNQVADEYVAQGVVFFPSGMRAESKTGLIKVARIQWVSAGGKYQVLLEGDEKPFDVDFDQVIYVKQEHAIGDN